MTKTYTPEQFAATSQAGIAALETMTTNAFAGMGKLVELNMAASKAVMADSIGHMKAVLAAKDPQEAMALQAAAFQPMAEKSVAYSRHIHAIATDASAEYAKSFEGKIAEAQESFAALAENMTKNAPAGSEAAVSFFKNSMTAGQNAIESAKASAKTASDTLQANMTAVSERAIKASASAYKKA